MATAEQNQQDENLALVQVDRQMQFARVNRRAGQIDSAKRNVSSAREWFYISRMFATAGTKDWDRWNAAYLRQIGLSDYASLSVEPGNLIYPF